MNRKIINCIMAFFLFVLLLLIAGCNRIQTEPVKEEDTTQKDSQVIEKNAAVPKYESDSALDQLTKYVAQEEALTQTEQKPPPAQKEQPQPEIQSTIEKVQEALLVPSAVKDTYKPKPKPKPQPQSKPQPQPQPTNHVSDMNTASKQQSNSATASYRPGNEASRDKKLTKYWVMIDNITEIAGNYYNDNKAATRLLSRNGYLYNQASGENISVSYLCDNEGLDREYGSYTTDILLIDGSDLKEIKELSIKSSDAGLHVFVATKHPEADKYLIASQNSTGGLISSADYRAILSKYSQNHGYVKKLYPGGEEYDRILSFIRMYEGKYDQYFVRSIAVDDKYASVILSSQSDANAVKHYILKNENNFWEVALSGLETASRLPVFVNTKLPDFNLNMLPEYEIASFRLKPDYSDVYAALINAGYITQMGDIKYIAGADGYCYAVGTDARKYVCNQADGAWTIKAFYNYDDARRAFLNGKSNAPAFLVLDE